MGNRKKLKDNIKRLKKNPSVLQRGIAAISRPSDRPHIPTADEVFSGPVPRAMQAELGDDTILTHEALLRMGFKPDDLASPEVVIKVVPAKHKGTTVGDAYIHEDGQVTLRFHEDAPKWALDEIKEVAGKIGYSLESGDYSGPS